MTTGEENDSWDLVAETLATVVESSDPDAALEAIEDPAIRESVATMLQYHRAATEDGFLSRMPDITAQNALQPGQELCGRFTIERFLGSGGMGQVFLASDQRLESLVAIKTIAPMLAPLPYMKRRFIAEVQNSRRVTHRNICRIYDYFEDGPTVFFAMEYLDGATLDALLKGPGGVKESTAKDWMLQLANGLQAAHDEGILHGDFKPGNVIITGGTAPRAVITDFGLARAMERDTPESERPAGYGGTLEFMAPEVAAGGPPTLAGDLFAFGRVAQRLLPDEKWWEPYVHPRPSQRPPSLKPVIASLSSMAPARRTLLFGGAAVIGVAAVAGYVTRQKMVPALPKGSRILVNGIAAVAPLAARARTVRNLFMLGLQQSPRLQLIPDREFLPAFRSLDPASTAVAAGQMLLRLAESTGAQYWIDSSLREINGRFAWALTLKRSADGLAIAEQSIGHNESPARLAEEGVRWLRTAAGESEESLRVNSAFVSGFTSTVPEALDRYAEAMELIYAGQTREAAPLLEEAIRLDPAFAQAHAMLGMAWNVRRRPELAIEHLERAVALGKALPEAEKSVIAANYYKMIEDAERMVEEARRNAVLRGYDAYYYRQFANHLCWTGAADESIAPSRRALEIAPRNDLLWNELVFNLSENGQYAAALAESDKAKAAGRNSPHLEYSRGTAYMGLADYGKALECFAKVPAAAALFGNGAKLMMGAVEPAISGWNEGRLRARSGGNRTEEAQFAEYMLGSYYLTDRLDNARQALRDIPQLISCPPHARGSQRKLFWASRLGETDVAAEATREIEEIANRWPNGFTQGMTQYAGAVAARRGGDAEKAERLIAESAASAFSVLTLIEAAEILEAAGKLDLAGEYRAKFEARLGTVYKLWFPGLALYAWNGRNLLARRTQDAAQAQRSSKAILDCWGRAQPQTSIVQNARI